MPMRFGHRVSGKITSVDDHGRGFFASPEGNFVVPFSAIGDEVVTTFLHRDRRLKVAKIESITTPSPDRVATPCPHAGVCGGCLWQHLSYDAQITLKQEMVNRAFEAAGHEERLTSIVRSTEQFHHRNRMDYAIGWNGEIGLKEYGAWNRYVNLTTCLLLADGVSEILQTVRTWMHAFDLQPWDAKFYTGDIRYVVIRDGKKTQQRLVTIVVKDATRLTDEMKKDLMEHLLAIGKEAGRGDLAPTSILIGEQSLQTDLSISQKFETLFGNPWIEEIVNDIRYRIHPNSFFQTNSQMAGTLQDIVGEFVGAGSPRPSEQILDLYCGLGFFSLYLAKHDVAQQIHGVEIDAEAIELAKHNAQTNGVAETCTFTAAKAEDMSWKDIPAETIILDPPRAGLHPKVLKTVMEKAPQTIAYVSCNYKRLVEELKEFKTAYNVTELRAVDLFPHSPHVEVLVKLEKKTNSAQ